MPDFRIHQSIAARADVGFNRRPNPLRRWRSIVSWCSFAAALLIVVLLYWHDDKSVYSSGATSVAHRMFENDCAKCHDQSFAPLRRLVRLDNSVHSVTADACTACHWDITIDDHSPRIAVHDRHAIENCAACHREHTGHPTLSRVSDQLCVQCHRDLKVQGGEGNVVTEILSFAEHPEFAVQDKDRQSPPGKGHAVRKVAEYNNAAWTDRAKIRFNHWKHLDPDGLPLPPLPSDPSGETQRKVLSCADCHVPDGRGQYMQPIRYEQHCRECHALEFSTRLAVGSGGARQSLPHVEPELIRGILRDRLMNYAKANPQEVLEQVPPRPNQAEAPRHPNKRRPSGPTAKDEWTWTEEMLAAMETGVRDGEPLDDEQIAMKVEAQKTISQVSYGCRHCHFIDEPKVDATDAARLIDWRIVSPNIPDRWLPYSRFDHSRHTQIACTACHDPQLVSDPDADLRAAGNETRLSSQSATDILMPSIKVCWRCHTQAAAPNRPPALASNTQGHARADCVECHDYHH